jgi:DNA (cytosine-5)-methyltransferase 1
MSLTYVELFAGAGGMSLGLEMAGWRCLAHAEIEPHARAVLRHRWPEVPLYGDVTTLDGTQFRGVTMITGGSPCQDLSIAGKRAGMVEGSGTRSSLFFEQVRIWKESGAPYILWENVYGAFSSNAGRDFAAVLSALVGAAVPVPEDGWVRAGVVAGPTGVAAFRVLDAQYFGVPQRRRRVFVLGVRAGGVDPAEVLSLLEGVSGNPAPRRQARQGAAAGVGAGASSAGIFNWQVAGKHGAVNLKNCSDALHVGQTPAVLTYDARGNGQGVGDSALTGDHQNRVTDYTAIVLHNREGKPGVGVPRRLTCVECERLMGWPDQHTAHGINEKGTAYALTDTARYKLCGNGIASPVTAWIGFQMARLLTDDK